MTDSTFTPRVFLSFSSRDSSAAGRILTALQTQKIPIWDYSDATQGLNPGSPLSTGLADHIARSTHFVALVTRHSVNDTTGLHTRNEVREAIRLGRLKQARLIPVTLVDEEPPDWLDCYADLQPLMRIQLDTCRLEHFTQGMAKLCASLGHAYMPDKLSDPRNFFVQPLFDEIGHAQLTNNELSTLLFRVIEVADLIHQHLWSNAEVQLQECRRLASGFQKFTHIASLYILSGVCHLQMQQIEEAIVSFQRVAEDLTFRHRERGVACAGIGHAHYVAGNTENAAHYFHCALELIPDDHELTVTIGALRASTPGATLSYSRSDPLNLALPSDRQFAAQRLKAAQMAALGEYRSTVELLQVLPCTALDDAAVYNFALSLEHLGYDQRAEDVFLEGACRLEDDNLYYHLNAFYLRKGDIDSSISLAERLLEIPMYRTPRRIIELVRMLRVRQSANDNGKLTSWCSRLINPQEFPLLNRPEGDFYYVGFAHYLLGNILQAEFTLSLSGSYRQYDYKTISYADTSIVRNPLGDTIN